MSSLRGTLFVVAAPSGAGKSSLVNAVLAREPGIALSISFTSRAARPGERHAQHYHFVDKAEFEHMIAAGDFYEHALVHGDYKGTARQSVEPQLAAGKDVLLEIDWQGARQVREQMPECVSVFILPPSLDALQTRMRNRGQDSEAVIAQRLAAAREEMSHHA
jgi:guanylate kinase